MRQYMLRRYHERRAEATALLGGQCASCGTEEQLQFDHIDKEDKEFDIAKFWSVSRERFLAELSKCQLLCGPCHKKKHAPKTHGTLSMYRYCKCDLCRKAKADWMRAYKRQRCGAVA